jgi:hypothetical protein
LVLTKEKQQEVYSRSSPLLSVTNVANENVNSEKQNRRTKITILLSAQRFHRDGEGRKNIFAASQKAAAKSILRKLMRLTLLYLERVS